LARREMFSYVCARQRSQIASAATSVRPALESSLVRLAYVRKRTEVGPGG
jgi:hypothetical protein